MPKEFGEIMRKSGVGIAAAGMYSLIVTDPSTTALGYVYRRHEWERFAQSNSDTVDKLLTELEWAGHIVVDDGIDIIVRDYMPRWSFDQPKYLQSGVYDLQQTIRSPLLRFLIGAELLRLDLTGMQGSKAVNVREAASALWREITDGDELPPIHHLRGHGALNPQMVDSLVSMPAAPQVLTELDKRQWRVVLPELADPLRESFARIHTSSVTPLKRTGGSAR